MLFIPLLLLAAMSMLLISASNAYADNYSGDRNKKHGNTTVVFDPKHHTWAAYRDGEKVRSGKASGGKAYCPDIGRGCRTIVGTFKVISKKGPGCKSSRFPVETRGGAPMPWCMHFHAKGYAIHGSPDVPNHNASHGCIRVVPADAKWLNQNFVRIGTTVVVLPYR